MSPICADWVVSSPSMRGGSLRPSASDREVLPDGAGGAASGPGTRGGWRKVNCCEVLAWMENSEFLGVVRGAYFHTCRGVAPNFAEPSRGLCEHVAAPIPDCLL